MSFSERGQASLGFRFARIAMHQHADAPDSFSLLRPYSYRPRRRAAESSDKLAPFHSITSSARASTMPFSFMQEPIFVDGPVKILGGVEPDRIHEPGGREVCAEEVGPCNGDTSEVGSPE
jgi:hypothetical protein